MAKSRAKALRNPISVQRNDKILVYGCNKVMKFKQNEYNFAEDIWENQKNFYWNTNDSPSLTGVLVYCAEDWLFEIHFDSCLAINSVNPAQLQGSNRMVQHWGNTCDEGWSRSPNLVLQWPEEGRVLEWSHRLSYVINFSVILVWAQKGNVFRNFLVGKESRIHFISAWVIENPWHVWQILCCWN